MQRIRFFPRTVAGAYKPAPGAVLISIHDRSEPALTPQPGWDAVLVQRFHDTDGTLMGLEVFNDAQATEILQFAEAHRSCNELIVHCQMGQSRSAAVALYLAEKYGVPCFKEGLRVTWENWKVYNKLVYRTLMNVDTAADMPPGAQ